MAREGKAPVLTPAEMRVAFKVAELTKHPLRNVCILHSSFHLALRACEIRRLRLTDVLESDGTTLVKIIRLLKTMTKKQKYREVPFTNKQARDAFHAYIQHRKEQAQLKGVTIDFNAPLFPSQKGGQFRENTIVMLFRKLYNIAGLRTAKSHTGRRSFITIKYRTCRDIKSLQKIAGHEDVNVTMGYIDDDPLTLQKISEKSLF